MMKSYSCFILLLMYSFGCSDSSNPVLQELDSELPNIHWFVELDGQFVEGDSVFIDTTKYSEIKLGVEIGFDDPSNFYKFTLGPFASEVDVRHNEGVGAFGLRGPCIFNDPIIDTPTEKLSCNGLILAGWFYSDGRGRATGLITRREFSRISSICLPGGKCFLWC